MTLPSALSLVSKIIPRSLDVETFGIAWVLGGYGTGGCKLQYRGVTNENVLAFGVIEV